MPILNDIEQHILRILREYINLTLLMIDDDDDRDDDDWNPGAMNTTGDERADKRLEESLMRCATVWDSTHKRKKIPQLRGRKSGLKTLRGA